MTGPVVSVVTPWLDHPELRAEYDLAIAAADPDEVLIIDDGSSMLVSGAAIRSPTNRGLAWAMNAGLALADGDVVVFLNNDIRLRSGPPWLAALLDAVEPGVLAGPEMRHDAHGWVDGQPHPYLDGWCIAARRDDFLRLGGWDTTYEEPSYYGDNDLCLRARAAGMRLVEVSIALEHLGNRTTNDNVDRRSAATAHNRLLYEQRVRVVTTSQLVTEDSGVGRRVTPATHA